MSTPIKRHHPGPTLCRAVEYGNMVFVAGTTAATAWIMGAIIDAMNNPTGRMHLYMVAFGVALIFFLKGVASFAQAVLMARAGNRIVARKQAQLYRKLLSQGMGFFSSRLRG